ncbi:hypothetical protein ACFSOZ_18175 [Mesorhizobium newzealandense]|uniref:Uncharacterized protein n=1 Tax=Mesorhizobium newzealandense TaxID=1300302 RepID=A0ABW4UD77_9HYPH
MKGKRQSQEDATMFAHHNGWLGTGQWPRTELEWGSTRARP